MKIVLALILVVLVYEFSLWIPTVICLALWLGWIVIQTRKANKQQKERERIWEEKNRGPVTWRIFNH